ncbi:ATP-binding protein [Streptomyces sp. NA04227]|uniref:ATP-binding protein n=1 Tax=Streptomyces sp. NA04227 TaxID=2742136 RepID=UPI00158FEED3|nr:ATP-binding protein [Streptomyces sp. NA04227]QKW06728.1 ATP-binding protein [Streptomyces sp. NA04227]
MRLQTDVHRPLRCVLPFAALPVQMAALRRAVRTVLGDWGATVVVAEAEVVVTELATNVVRHVGEGASAAVVLELHGHQLRVEVHDTASALPVRTGDAGDQREEAGRGLHLISALCDRWGARLTQGGKSVWCELALPANCVPRQVLRAAALLDTYGEGARAEPAVSRSAGVVLHSLASDVITDLLHWLAAQGADLDEALDKAQMRYEAETGAA